MYTYICENCKQEFKTFDKNQKFCSLKCMRDFLESQRVDVVCAECGKQERVCPSRAKKYLCCSTTCLGQYHKKKYAKMIKLNCPICGKEYECKQSKIANHRTCGNASCRKQWLEQTRKGEANSNYKSVEDILKNDPRRRDIYYHIVKEHFKLGSLINLRKCLRGYDIHHKNCDHTDNRKENLIIIPHNIHMTLHRHFGNILLNALHSNRITLDIFKQICTEEQWLFYKDIYDLDITRQVVVKQGELLETPEEDNQQANLYRNIYGASTTNSRVLPDNAGDSNTDTSALPVANGDDIV